MTVKGLKNKYKEVCSEYVSKFCRKQDLDFEGWVADEVGQVVFCGDFCFNFSDIVLDINTNQKAGLIIEWYYSLTDEFKCNYASYIKGYRPKQLKKKS